MRQAVIEATIVGAAIVAFGGAALFFGQRLRAASRARAAAQLGYFDQCLPLLADVRRAQSPHGFARISGRFGDMPVDLQALPDLLSYRKLPALWVMVTVPAPMPIQATLSVMRRPSGTEVFSQADRLHATIATPAGFPVQTTLHTDDPEGLPDESIVLAQASLFADDRAKELVLSPKGLRIVWLADEADRSRYLLFRDAELGRRAFPADELEPLLIRLAALSASLRAAYRPTGNTA